MKVIKVVDDVKGKLVSTYARGRWKKEYAKGVETKPKVGYLFAYSKGNIKQAMRIRYGGQFQYWLAEANVVGKVRHSDITVEGNLWSSFWKGFKLQMRNKGADHLLCSSITLIKEIK